MSTTKAVKVDTSKLGGRVAARSNPDKVGLPHGHQELPYDLPTIIEVERVLTEMGDPAKGLPMAMGLAGHIISLDCFVQKKKVWVKLYRDPNALVVEVDGETVYRWVANPDDQPIKMREVLDEAARVGSAFVEMNDIQPGDEVLDGDVPGTVVINRATEHKHDRRARRTDKATTARAKAKAAPEPDWEDELVEIEDDEDEIVEWEDA